MAPLDQIDQIQDLVAEIDGVLRNDDRPWILGGRVRQRQRQTLEHLRSALTRLGGELRRQPPVHSTAASPTSTTLAGQPPRIKSSAITYGSAQAAIDSFTQDLQTLRQTLLQSLQSEVATLQEQRDQLRREIQELQRQPGQTIVSEGMMQAFLQQLLLQLQERLSLQVQQSMAQQLAAIGQPLVLPPGSDSTSLAPIDQAQSQLAQIQHLHNQSETLVRHVDSTLTVFAETLEQNMRTYQQALEQGLAKMHSMGQQGEFLFAEFVNRLASRLEDQASAYFQGSQFQSGDFQGESSSSIALPSAQSGFPRPATDGSSREIPVMETPSIAPADADLGPGLADPIFGSLGLAASGAVAADPGQAGLATPIAMDLTDGSPLLPLDSPLTEVTWQPGSESNPEPALDVAARVRPLEPILEPISEPSPITPIALVDPSRPEPLSPTESPAASRQAPPSNELDAFYADLMLLTGGIPATDLPGAGLVSAVPGAAEPPVSPALDLSPTVIADAPIAPARRGSVDQQPIAQPPRPADPADDVVQSLGDLFGDTRRPTPDYATPSPISTSDVTDLDADIDNGLFAHYSVAGPADGLDLTAAGSSATEAQKKNLN